MNKLELFYKCGDKLPAKDAKAILNGEDVTSKTIQVVWGLECAFITFHKGWEKDEAGQLTRITEDVRLDEIKLNG